MVEPGKSGALPPATGPSPQDLEERWKEAVDALGESPRNVDLLLRAGQISEQLRRPLEAYTYYRRALGLDPSRSFLVARLRALATTPEQKEDVAKLAARPASFEASLGDLFRYPFRGKGLLIVIAGSVVFGIVRILLRGGAGLPVGSLAFFASAYLAMFYIEVCHTTIGGEEELPDWPDPLQVAELGWDILKFFVPKVVSFLPVLLVVAGFHLGDLTKPVPREIADFQMEYAKRGPGSSSPDASAPTPAPPASLPGAPSRVVLPILIALGCLPLGLLYLPMATLANVVLGSPWACLRVPFVVRSMFSVPKGYAICLAMYVAVLAIAVGAEAGAAAVGIVPTGIGLAFIELLGMTVLMRLLGLFYRMNQAKLAWLTG